MPVIGGFRSDLSKTRKTDGNVGKFPQVFCFPKSRINENGGKESQTLCYETRCIQLYVKISLTITTKTFPLTILSTKNYNFFIFATEDIPC